ncbi:unnamed protein product [Cylicocyclus nassatus]|uniref:Uncharacterized protein n=1 Tax=Cylicocyclus nassatus TaxID=53992 RepID=A0AA36GIB2_CYLNA|nr:unnamed protein product [Cylicocyclus nassatus]
MQAAILFLIVIACAQAIFVAAPFDIPTTYKECLEMCRDDTFSYYYPCSYCKYFTEKPKRRSIHSWTSRPY